MTPVRNGSRAEKAVRRRENAPLRPSQPLLHRLFSVHPFRLLRAAFVYLAVFIAAFASVMLWRSLLSTELVQRQFAVREVTVDGCDQVPADAVLRLAAVPAGSILDVNVDAAARRVESHPWIRQARVARRFPHTILVSVEEHVPFAVLKVGREFHLVDDRGQVFKRREAGEGVRLPVITGISARQVREGGPALEAALAEVRDFVDRYREERRLAGWPIGELHHGREGLTLFVARQGIKIQFGRQEIGRKLDMLARLAETFERHALAPSFIFLNNQRVKNRADVRFKGQTKTL